MMTTHIIYKGRKPDTSELYELFPLLQVTYEPFKGEIKTIEDAFYKIRTLDFAWMQSLFKGKDLDIRCLVLTPTDLKGVGINKHWGFYDLNNDMTHDFYMTNLKSDPRAQANGFKTPFAWMFIHEYLHGIVWERTRDKELAASLVHEWEKQGLLKQKLKEHLEYYQLLQQDVIAKQKEVQTRMTNQRLQIYRPTLSKNITQGWGENKVCIDNTGRIFGVNNVCPAGSQSFYKSVGMLGHNGIDIADLQGSNIYHCATFSGWWRSEVDARGGIGVDIVSNEPLYFDGPVPAALKETAVVVGAGFVHYVKMRYWHLKAPIGSEGKQVTLGTIIGLMGNTGASAGVHLQFAPKWCLKDGRSVANDNGYNGAFDPTPYYTHAVSAVTQSEFITKNAVPLSTEEKKDMLAQLSLMQQMLLAIKNVTYKI